MNQAERRIYLQRAERQTNRLIRKYQPKIKAHLDATAEEAARLVETQGPQAINLLDPTPWVQPLLETYRQMFTESFTQAARSTMRSARTMKRTPGMGYAEDWTMFVQNWLRENGLKLVVTITGNSRDLYIDIANRTIQAAVAQGLNPRETAGLIVSHLRDEGYTYSNYRALRIARTETVRAANEGHIKGADDLPFLTNKQWISANDERTRVIPRDRWDHAELDGLTIKSEDYYVAMNEDGVITQAFMPGDINCPAGFTINCRCRVALIGRRDANGRLMMKPDNYVTPPRIAPAQPALPTAHEALVQPPAPAPRPVQVAPPAAPKPPKPKPAPAKPKPVPTAPEETQTNWFKLDAETRKKIIVEDQYDNRLTLEELEKSVKKYGMTLEQFLNLGGGLPQASAKLININVTMTRDRDYANLRINTDMHHAQRSIDLANKWMENDLLKVTHGSPKGTGLNLFLNQVTNAREAGFKQFHVYAAGDVDSDTYNGYYTWARFGYHAGDASAKNLAGLLNRAPGKPADLFELMSTKEGQAWWKQNGRGFEGRFDLLGESKNIKRLREYAISNGKKPRF